MKPSFYLGIMMCFSSILAFAAGDENLALESADISASLNIERAGPSHGGGGPHHGGGPIHGGNPGHGGWHGPVHVHPPVIVHGGYTHWHHWDHPYFSRPTFRFDWASLRVVTCVAQDSYGYQYPVTEDGYYSWDYQRRMDQIEDAALDRCYYESGGDPSCYLVGCQAGY